MSQHKIERAALVLLLVSFITSPIQAATKFYMSDNYPEMVGSIPFKAKRPIAREIVVGSLRAV